MGKCGCANKRLSYRHMHISDLTNVAGCICQLIQLLRVNYVIAKLQLQIRDNRAEVSVAAALSITIHRTLNLLGACTDSGKRVGDSQFTVVVRMNAKSGSRNTTSENGYDVIHLMRHSTAVRVAHDKPVCSGFFCFAHYG
ncbi:hypothetical protein D3C77_521260 [compost metagenome]